MAERWIQDLLLPEKVYRSLEKPHIRGPLAITTIDSTPSYEDSMLIDSIKTKLGNPHNLKFSLSEQPTTPLDLIQPHDGYYFHILQSADATKRTIEVAGSQRFANDDINIMIDSPIKSLAWILFLRTTRQIGKKDAKNDIDFTKCIINRFKKNLLNSGLSETEILHVIKIVNPEIYTEEKFGYFDKQQIILLKARTKIFNGCLKTAAKIFTRETGEEIVYTK